ncbi:MAG TPA: hypothetical protein VK507_10920, partial [Iamia sp.]|nr:hypothetical protein [Iamia sp.]
MTGRVASIDVLVGADTHGPSARAARRALLAYLSPIGDVHELGPGVDDVSIPIRADLARSPLFLLAQVPPTADAPWLVPDRPAHALATIERAAALVALKREQHDLVSAATEQAALDAALAAAQDLSSPQLRDALRPTSTVGALSSRFTRMTTLLAGD